NTPPVSAAAAPCASAPLIPAADHTIQAWQTHPAPPYIPSNHPPRRSATFPPDSSADYDGLPRCEAPCSAEFAGLGRDSFLSQQPLILCRLLCWRQHEIEFTGAERRLGAELLGRRGPGLVFRE